MAQITKVSLAGVAAIAQREGRRLKAYRDSKGILTIGVGHTGRMSPPRVWPWSSITAVQCDAYLATDLAPVEAEILKCVKAPITQNQFDALASLAFNIGNGGLAGSSVVKMLNAGNFAEAANDFLLWDHPSSLLGRRKEERAQFLTP